MKFASKLRGAFALYIALLAGVLVYHVRTIRHSVESGHELTEISSRYRVVSNVQLGRVADMGNSAEKFLVTRDRGYLDKLANLAGAYGEELRRLESLPLTPRERKAMATLAERWLVVEKEMGRLQRDSSYVLTAETLTDLEGTLDEVALATQLLGGAAEAGMTRELEASETAARDAERIAWGAAVIALVLSVLLSVLLVRSIVRPLERLANGAREITAGRLGFRLDATGRDELAQVAHEFNTMTAQLEELDRMKRDFVSNVSHDLKTPLSSMQEANEVLLDELPGPLLAKQRHLLELSRDSGRRLSAMIGKLLDLSRLESMGAPAHEPTDLTQLARMAADRANVAQQRRGARVILETPTERMLVSADGDGIAHVLDNILENALKFSPSDGTVRIAVTSSEDSAVVTVADEGPGIPDAEKERVFERFYQTDAGRAARARGAGLGLAICRHIVVAHGGSIQVRDNTPRGCVLTVTLPALAGARQEAEALVA